jgi:hypothetical protein
VFKISFSGAEVNRSFHSSCNTIWELLTDTDTWPQWGPSVSAVECENRFIRKGTIGKVKTAVGIWLPFIVTGYEDGYFWSWDVAGIPATGHRVEPLEDEHCLLTFEIPLLTAPYAYICKIALDRIAGIIDESK